MVRTIARHKVRMSVNRGTVHNLAVTHVQDAMAVGGGFGIVRDHDDGLAEILIELAEQTKDSFGAFRIEVAGGLIRQDDLWFADDGARQRYALLFTAGKLGGFVLQTAAQAEEIGNDLKAVGIESISVNVLGQSDVVVGIESGKQIETLKDEADFVAAQQSARGVAHGSEVVAIEEHASGGGLCEASNHVQHG
jgi:hypothetical protein